VGAAAERPAALRARRAFRQSLLVDERGKYFVAALFELRGVHPYHLRRSRRRVWLRHPDDSWTFEEIFGAHAYELPRPIRAMLEMRPDVLVGDLGANIGLFGAYILDVLPQARVIGYEPDPGNASVCDRSLGPDEKAGRYRLIRAAAGTRAGVELFLAGLGGRSRVVEAKGPDTLAVSVEDVMPLLTRCDLVKIDIEGSEWALLTDDRLRTAGPRSLALEFHAERCPDSDPEGAARDLLTAAGYVIVPPARPYYEYEFPPGQGMLWAIRRPSE
jgi:FkbM family methyltransferase